MECTHTCIYIHALWPCIYIFLMYQIQDLKEYHMKSFYQNLKKQSYDHMDEMNFNQRKKAILKEKCIIKVAKYALISHKSKPKPNLCSLF